MVRNVVGTLAEIGRGRWPAEKMAQALVSRDRCQAGPTAPSHGLCLLRVEYFENPTPGLDTAGGPGDS
jgi:tRNA pseudouridine38-40 synthase